MAAITTERWNFIAAQDKAREASIKGNMRTAQIAVEM